MFENISANAFKRSLCSITLISIFCVLFCFPVYAENDTQTLPPTPGLTIDQEGLFNQIGGFISDEFNEYQEKTNERIDGFLVPDNLSNTFLDTLTRMLTQSTSQTVASMFDPLLQFSLSFMLKIENCVSSLSLGNSLSAKTIATAYNAVYILACGLAFLKYLSKGFQIYILWRDGDPETSPSNMLTGLLSGVLMMLIFPTLYDIIVDVTTWFSDMLMQIFHINSQLTPTQSFLSNLTHIVFGGGFIQAILSIVWTVMIIVLFIRMLGRGVELLTLRIGFPIACLGLIDSDGGLFKGYMQIFFKTMATSIIQICLISLSFSVVVDVGVFNLLVGIAFVSAAFATPTLMQSLLIQNRPGGLNQKIYSTGMAINMLRGVVRK